MIRSLKELLGYKVEEINAEKGTVEDFLFDEKYWTIRYLEIDMGIGFPGEKLLVGRGLLKKPKWESKHFPIAVTMNQLKNAPKLKDNFPFSREKEKVWNQYYGTPSYWDDAYIPPKAIHFYNEKTIVDKDLHSELKSFNDIIDYEINVENEIIGHCSEVLIDDDKWEIKYLVATISGDTPSKKKEVMLSLDWIKKVDYDNRKIYLNKNKKFVKNAPKYSPAELVNEIYEKMLDDYHVSG